MKAAWFLRGEMTVVWGTESRDYMLPVSRNLRGKTIQGLGTLFACLLRAIASPGATAELKAACARPARGKSPSYISSANDNCAKFMTQTSFRDRLS